MFAERWTSASVRGSQRELRQSGSRVVSQNDGSGHIEWGWFAVDDDQRAAVVERGLRKERSGSYLQRGADDQEQVRAAAEFLGLIEDVDGKEFLEENHIRPEKPAAGIAARLSV